LLFANDPTPPEIYTLSLHDALPILTQIRCADCGGKNVEGYRTYPIKDGARRTMYHCASCGCSFSETKQTPLAQLKTPISVIVQRSEEHTSELQSLTNIVCRLLL